MRLSLIGALPTGKLPGDELFDYSPGVGGKLDVDVHGRHRSMGVRLSADVVHYSGDSDASVTSWGAHAGLVARRSRPASVRPYATASAGVALNVIRNCGLTFIQSGRYDPSADCDGARAHAAAALGVGLQQSRGPLFVELRYLYSGPRVSSITAGAGLAY